MDEVAVGTLLASTLRVSTPLILCALAGCAERALRRDRSRASKARCCSPRSPPAAAAAVSGSLALALLLAIAVGVALSMLHGYACVSHRGDQVVMGMAITMTAAGLTVVLGIAWFQQGGQTPPLPDAVRLAPWFARHRRMRCATPGADRPVLGHRPARPQRHGVCRARCWCRRCGGCCARTRFGLRLRAAGENPAMVDAAGVSVHAAALSGARA